MTQQPATTADRDRARRGPTDLGAGPATGAIGTQGADAYLRTKVLTASPEELRQLLLDGALRFARRGRQGIDTQNYEDIFEGFSHCRNIILELVNSMKPEINPELCEQLRGLYMFMYTELLHASHDRDAERADNVIELLEYECETWRQLRLKIADERAATGTDSAPQTPAPATAATIPAAPAAPAAGYRPISIQG